MWVRRGMHGTGNPCLGAQQTDTNSHEGSSSTTEFAKPSSPARLRPRLHCADSSIARPYEWSTDGPCKVALPTLPCAAAHQTAPGGRQRPHALLLPFALGALGALLALGGLVASTSAAHGSGYSQSTPPACRARRLRSGDLEKLTRKTLADDPRKLERGFKELLGGDRKMGGRAHNWQ